MGEVRRNSVSETARRVWRAEIPANCGRFARSRNSRQFAGLFGGPGTTRTCNQTVMSGKGLPKDTDKTDELDED